MGNAIQLISNRLIYIRVAMAMDVAPKRTRTIKIAIAIYVGQPTSLGRVDD